MMRKVILASVLIAMALVAFGQHRKSVPTGGKAASKTKPKPKPTPSPKSTWEKYTPCGVYYADINDFISDLNKGWQLIADTKSGDHFWYDSDTERCGDGGVLKVWIKVIHDSKVRGDHSLVQYELKCKTDELRIKSRTEYDKDGKVLEVGSLDDVWEDAIPDSIGAEILKTVCRSP